MKYSHNELYAEICKILGFTFLVTLFVYFAIWKFKRRNFEKMGSKFPGPFAYPILGNAIEGACCSPEQILTKLAKYSETCGSTFRVWIGPMLFIVVGKPEHMEVICNSKNALQKPEFFSRFLKYSLGGGLITSNVKRWKKHRRIISPAFNSSLLSKSLPNFITKSQELMNTLRPYADTGKIIDLWPHLSISSISTVCCNFLCQKLNTNDVAVQYAETFKIAHMIGSKRIYKIWLHVEWIFNLVTRFNGSKKILESIKTLPLEIIKQQKISYKQKEGEISDVPKNFMDILIEHKKCDPSFTDEDILDEMLSILAAGSDTNAINVSLTLLMLAMHPDIQENVYAEVKSTCNNKKELSLEDIHKMVYLEQCVKETLRLFPPAPMFLRLADADIKLDTHYTIPAGANIVGAIHTIHHDPTVYPDPYKWNPDNFLPHVHENRHKYSFVPFSGGPRGCIGNKYAMLSTKVTLATAILNYKFETNIKIEDIKFEFMVTLSSIDGYPVKIYSRER